MFLIGCILVTSLYKQGSPRIGQLTDLPRSLIPNKAHMADKHSKSKLKRKKSSVVEPQADRYQRGSLPKFSIPFNSPDLTKDHEKTESSKGNRG